MIFFHHSYPNTQSVYNPVTNTYRINHSYPNTQSVYDPGNKHVQN